MKIAVLSSHTTSLFWFRMDMIKDFIAAGHTVCAVGNEPAEEWKDRFSEYGVEYYQIHVARNGTNPFNDLNTYKSIKQLLSIIKPEKIFVYQAKTIIYGALAAHKCGISEVYPLVAGLGSIIRGSGIKNTVLKTIIKTEYRLACKYSKKIFFQNEDDRGYFLTERLTDKGKTVIINGSGVNLDVFSRTPLPEKTAFLFIGRLISDKGVREYLSACKKIKERYPEVRCLLVGPFDTNPSAITEKELQPYIDSGIVEFFGEQRDVRKYLQECTAFVLPSYHEGTPKSVLEAMAIGRAVITTDAPGCRETVQDGENGFLVPVGDADTVAEKMEYMIEYSDRTEAMAQPSYEKACEKYDVHKVNRVIMNTMDL